MTGKWHVYGVGTWQDVAGVAMAMVGRTSPGVVVVAGRNISIRLT